jgi:endonuclease/exonuclease/phosphatase family metal-dependent hydrolase
VASLNVWFDEILVRERIDAIVHLVLASGANVVFMQEVTPDMCDSFQVRLNRRGFQAANTVEQAYGEMIFVKGLPILDYKRYPFPNTRMGRGLHIVETSFQSRRIVLATSHLESLAEHRSIRLAQLDWSMKFLRNRSCPWIFGGDMNLGNRDKCKLPSEVDDAWLSCGSPSRHEFTWDTTINHNLPGITFNAKCRFDRLFSHGILPRAFSTFGKEALAEHPAMFPSDHWGILATYETFKSHDEDGDEKHPHKR